MENTSPAKTSSLPSIGVLFTDSWQAFIHSILSLFILNVVGIVIYLGVTVLAVLLFILSGAGSFLLKNGLQGLTDNLPNILSSFLVPVLAISVVFGVIYIIISVVFLQISSVLIVNSQGKISVGSAFKKSFGLIIPLFLVGMLTFILSFGALFVLILPVLLFVFLLSFTQFEVVLNNQKWIRALKRSVAIVSKNFGGILIRWLLIMLIYVAIVVIIPNLLRQIGPETQVVVGIFSFIVNLLLGWYMLAYQVTLYKQAKATVGNEETKSIVWMWVIAVIGWLIAIGIFFASYKAISSGLLENLMPNPSINQNASLLPADLMKDADDKIQKVIQIQNDSNATSSELSQVPGLISSALSEYKQVVESDSSNLEAWSNLAVLNERLGNSLGNNNQGASQTIFFNEAANAYYNLGKVYQQKGSQDLAEEALQKALQIVPNTNKTLKNNVQEALEIF